VGKDRITAGAPGVNSPEGIDAQEATNKIHGLSAAAIPARVSGAGPPFLQFVGRRMVVPQLRGCCYGSSRISLQRTSDPRLRATEPGLSFRGRRPRDLRGCRISSAGRGIYSPVLVLRPGSRTRPFRPYRRARRSRSNGAGGFRPAPSHQSGRVDSSVGAHAYDTRQHRAAPPSE
jgi:hypothetical protein